MPAIARVRGHGPLLQNLLFSVTQKALKVGIGETAILR